MSLADLVYKKRKAHRALDVPPHTSPCEQPNVANVADVAVATFTDAASGDALAIVPPDCVGALTDPDSGALFLPWGPYVDPDEVCRQRTELVTMIEQLSTIEGWSALDRVEVLTAARRASLWALSSDRVYFAHRLSAARAEEEKRAALNCGTGRGGSIGGCEK